MEALLWQIASEGTASCMQHILEQLRLPFHTAKCSPQQLVVLMDPAGPGFEVPGIRVGQRCKGSSALCQAATPRAYKGAAGEKTSNK